MAPKIDEKSTLRRGCVFYGFGGRPNGLGRPLSAKGGLATSTGASILATIFDQKSKKWHPKRHPKIDAEKVSNNYEKNLQKDAKMDAEI